MKVKAKRWINVDGVWHGKDDVFETESVAGFADAVEVLADGKPEKVEPAKQKTSEPISEKKAEKPAENTRRRYSRK